MSEVWTVLKILQWTTGYLQEKGVENARLDSELLLAAALGLDRVGLYLNYDRPLEGGELERYRGMVARRAKREPVQYILGEAEFWSLPLMVTPAVLIPRADTEVLVEEGLKRLTEAPGPVLDVGTGSGAIVLALASEAENSDFTALDISPEALAIAKKNAERHGFLDRVQFLEGDLAALPAGSYHLIVSNPPYIPAGEMAILMPEVRDFEPTLALQGGDDDGLAAYRLLAKQAVALLAPGGWLLVEVGAGQAAAVEAIFSAAGLQQCYLRDDYAGIARVVGGCRSEKPL